MNTPSDILRAVHAITEAQHAMGCAAVAIREAQVELGAALRSYRKAKGISLRTVAAKLSLSAPFISDCELGRRTLSDAHRKAYVQLIS